MIDERTMPSPSDCMDDLNEIARDDLWNLEIAWRRRALRGDRSAHGPAHLCDVAYRQRFGPEKSAQHLRELRPLAVLPAPKRWRFWPLA